MPKAIKLIMDFIMCCETDQSHNQWLKGSDFEIYVRHSWRFIKGKRLESLEIASVNAKRPGHGDFTRFLNQVEEINPYECIYIENLLTTRFEDFFLKRGYTSVSHTDPPCVYKIKSK